MSGWGGGKMKKTETYGYNIRQWRGNYFRTGGARPKAATPKYGSSEIFLVRGARLKASESGFIANYGSSSKFDYFM